MRPERPALVVAMFHVLFADAAAMNRHEVDPQQRTTTAVFAQFVAHFLAARLHVRVAGRRAARPRPGRQVCAHHV
ncbi:MAG: hypothetical protein WKG07_39415 [Hymenobacter sp.]